MTSYLKRILDIIQLGFAILSGPVAFCFLVFQWGVEKIVSVSGDLISAVASYALPGASFDLVDAAALPLARINTFIPLAEAWVMMLAYLSLLVQVVTWRFVKSLIPGMSN